MNPPATQLAFPFASLDFEGFTVLTVDQIATKLRCSSLHVLNLVEQGELVAVDKKSKGATRRDCRIPLESYRAFIIARLTGPAPQTREFIAQLPRSVRIELIQELKASLQS